MKLPKYITTGLATLAMVAHMYAANPVQVKTIADYVKKKGTVGQYDEKNKGRFKEFDVQFPNSSNKSPIKIWVAEIGGLESLIDVMEVQKKSTGDLSLQLLEKSPYDGVLDGVTVVGESIIGQTTMSFRQNVDAESIPGFQTFYDRDIEGIFEQIKPK